MTTQTLKTEEEFEKELQNLVCSHNIVEFKKRDFVEGNKLGQGGFGKVISASYLSMKCAIKKIKEYHPKEIFREIYIMKKYSHPSIPGLYGIIKYPIEKRFKSVKMDPSKLSKLDENIFKKSQNTIRSERKLMETASNSNNNMVSNHPHRYDIDLVLEVIEGDTLEKLLKKVKFTDLEKLLILLNFATVLEYLHEEKIIHRDLKPANIMIDKKFEFKLLDFGISKVTQKDRDFTRTVSIGTMCYMAPENFIIVNEDSIDKDEDETTSRIASEITDKVDVWAFGCIVQEIWSGVKPWINKVKNESKILAFLYSKKPFEITNLIPKESKIRDLIEKCVVIQPEKRISIKEAKKMLQEILFDTFTNQMVNLNLHNNLEEGLVSMYKMFNNISNLQKFHVLRKLEHYIFEHYQNVKAGKTMPSSFKPKTTIKFLFKKKANELPNFKFLHDFHQQTNLNFHKSLLGKFLEEAKKINEDYEKNHKKELEENNDDNNKYLMNLIDGTISFTKGTSCLKESSFGESGKTIANSSKKVRFFFNEKLIIQPEKKGHNDSPRSAHSNSGISNQLKTIENYTLLNTSTFNFSLESGKVLEKNCNKYLLFSTSNIEVNIENSKKTFLEMSLEVSININSILTKNKPLSCHNTVNITLLPNFSKGYLKTNLVKIKASQIEIIPPSSTCKTEETNVSKAYKSLGKSLEINLLKSLITPRNQVQNTYLPKIYSNRLPYLNGENLSISPESRTNDYDQFSQRDEFKCNDEKIINKYFKSRLQKGVDYKIDYNSFKLNRQLTKEFSKKMQGYAKEIIVQTNKKMNLQVIKESAKCKGTVEKKKQGLGKFIRGVMSPLIRRNDSNFDMDDPLKSLIIKNSK